MAAVLRRIIKCGLSQVEYSDVVEDFEDICVRTGRIPPSPCQILSISLVLSRYRLLISERSKAGYSGQKIQLNINESELITHFGSSEVSLLKTFFND
jgi:hypothetical protein